MRTNHDPYKLLIILVILLITMACSLTSTATQTEPVEDAEHFIVPGLNIDISYKVSPEGEAKFWLEQYPDIAPLTSKMDTQEIAFLEWNGKLLDGYGILDASESQMLSDLATSPYSQAVPLIALERACQSNGELTAEQLAALLFPWQMHLKYSPIDRMAEIRHFVETSSCSDYFREGNYLGYSADTPTIMISNEAPFPVVLGYFPFDPEGAYEMAQASSGGCQLFRPVSPLINEITIEEIPLLKEIPFNEMGPCNAGCRGACGLGCTTSNCKVEDVFRCFTDEKNELTGFGVQVKRFSCGVHEGCVTHDACYDSCNRAYGCDTFWASWCMHGTRPGNCDGDSIEKYGYQKSVEWAFGGGEFSTSYIFDYTENADYESVEDLEKCPAKREVDISEVTPQQFTISGEFEETLFDETFPVDPSLCSPGKGTFSFTMWNVGALAGEGYSAVTAVNTKTPYFEYYLADWPGETVDRCVTYDNAVDQTGKDFRFSGGPNGTITLGGQVIGQFYEGRTFQFYNVGFSPRTFSVSDQTVFSAWTNP